MTSAEKSDNSLEEKKPDISLLLAEYDALREEIVKRTDTENQLTTFTIIIFGTILSIGSQNKMASLILLYPTLALFMTITLAHNDYLIRQIATYIRDHIELVAGKNNIGWEHFLAVNPHPLQFIWAIRGILLTTEILAIIVGISIAPLTTTFLAVLIGRPIAHPDLITNLLLGIAIVSLPITFFMSREMPAKSAVSPLDQGI